MSDASRFSPTSDEPAALPPRASLTPSQKAAIAKAQRQRRTLDHAAGLAAFNGWTLLIFAGLSILVSQDAVSIIVTALFAFAGFRELQGRRLIKQLKPAGPKLLGYNQILLAGIVTGYCLWCIFDATANPSSYSKSLASVPSAQRLLDNPTNQHMIAEAVVLVYGSVILTSLITQGLMATYYFTRLTYLRAYLEDTPEWVVQMQQAMK